MDALRALADDEYRQDIISNNIGDWIINGQSYLFQQCLYETSITEYRTASKRLGDVLDEDPYTLYSRRSSPVFDIISRLLGELPMVCSQVLFFTTAFIFNFGNFFIQVFCAFSALANPCRLSLASVAILQQSSGTFSWSLEIILRSNEDFRKSVSSIRKMYEAFLVANSMSDGTLAYPPVSEKGDINSNGMSFELRYIDSLHHH